MPLTVRSNGVAGGLVSASWWNDYASLLTGGMADQPVTINNSLELTGIGVSTTAPTLTLATGTTMGIGLYKYAVSYVMGDAETVPITTLASITTTSGNQNVAVSAIPLGPAGTTKRKVWRTKVGGSQLYLDNTLNDNTTTSYTDSTADSGISTLPPATTSIGGLIIKDVNGNKNFIVGTNGDIMWTGKLGISLAGDVIDATSGTGSLYFKAPAGNFFEFQIPNGTTAMRLGANYISVPSFLGVKTTGGTKLGEFKNNGNFTIAGSQYQTTGGAISTTTGATFDSFDVGEVFECDKEYPNGTVVCPGPENKLTLCTHDNCPFALLISHNPGLGLGANDHENGIHYVAMAGRVNARTAQDLHMRNFVVSDGRGGVRAAKPGEGAFVLGFTLNSTSVIDSHAVVGVYIRPQFLTFRSA